MGKRRQQPRERQKPLPVWVRSTVEILTALALLVYCVALLLR